MTRAEKVAVAGFVAFFLLLLAIAGGVDRADAAMVEDAYVEEAVAYWQLPTDCPQIVGEYVPGDSLEGGVRDGESEPALCRFRVPEGLPSCTTRAIVIHEVGHILGLPHSSDPSSFMYPYTLDTICAAEAEALYQAATAADRRRRAIHEKRRQRRAEKRRAAVCRQTHRRCHPTRVNGAHAAQKRSQK